MQRVISIQCGHDQHTRSKHLKRARRLIAQTGGPSIPLELQRGIWFSCAATYEGCTASAVALALHLDERQHVLPVAKETGIELTRPPAGDGRKATLNILFVVGVAEDLTTLALADAVPPYLGLVSNLETLLVVEEVIAVKVVDSFGWRRVANLPMLPTGFVSLSANSAPFRSFCARALAFGREADGQGRVYLDGIGINDGTPPVLVADSDAQCLAMRVWENCEEEAGNHKVVEITPVVETEGREKVVIDRSA